MKVPLPNDQFLNYKNDFYDHREYEALCSEFNISKNNSFLINTNYKMPTENFIPRLPQEVLELKTVYY